MKRFLLVAMIALAITPCIAADLPVLGDPPPVLSLPNLEGKPINLSDFSGKPIILTFFASWSKSCQQELADLQELSDQYAGTLEVVTVSFDKKIKTLSEFVEQNKYTLNFLIDKKLTSLNKYAILIIPTTFCINREGKIDKIFVDYDENVKTAIAEWLK